MNTEYSLSLIYKKLHIMRGLFYSDWLFISLDTPALNIIMSILMIGKMYKNCNRLIFFQNYSK